MWSVLAQAQREQHRRAEAQRRAADARQRENERARREAQRTAARGEREALKAYQQGRESDAARRSAELDARVAELRGVLAAGLAGPGFSLAAGGRPAVPPFDPGPLGVPVPMPDQAWYLVPPPAGHLAYDPGARRQWEEHSARARAAFEHDWQAAWAAEQQRQRQLADYRAQYDAWAAERHRLLAGQSAQAGQLAARLRAGEAAAVAEYFEAVVDWREDWPDGFPADGDTAWDAPARRLVVRWELPPYEVVPAVGRYRYVRSDDREDEVARPATQRRELYREMLAQCALRVLAEVFRADTGGLLASVGLNGVVVATDPATGREGERCLLAVEADRAVFEALALDRVAPLDCFVEALGGRIAARPERADTVAEVPAAAPAPGVQDPDGAEGANGPDGADGPDGPDGADPDLFEMDPLEFEELIAELFRRRGLRTSTTARSGDEGVDVLAEDPDPITGGKIVIQAKRYRKTVPPSAVRDLESTMRHQGANRGILVTTAGFGPSSRRHVENKPLTLVDGPMLLELLREQGLPGRLGPAAPAAPAVVPAQRSAPAAPTTPATPTLPAVPAAPAVPATELAPGQNLVLPDGEVRVRFRAGGAAADLTLLLLDADGKVRRDEDFVFYHQPVAEGGAVALRPDDRSATVLTGRLPDAVRRVAISVNLDADGDGTCADLVDPAVELASGTGRWVFRPPADPAVSAMLVAEVYRHPADGWKLRAVGQGWADGLAGLARDHGVDVA
ncbi:restriction endonuclease [Kitasatospora sp. NA04385]|uniref:restriction endonuclease n=1 Tax=Kitasatospora sp. NA04385 TaxID=2742135 RepID=UPI001590A6F9|nr:restriction endonuclease [Kitasatospora sp. NA04385]QKW22006.1 restriction endonuclease [Kitasatospora sp. NA04385]